MIKLLTRIDVIRGRSIVCYARAEVGARDPAGSPEMALNALRVLRASGPLGHVDTGYPSLPDRPLGELPPIFQMAKDVGTKEAPDQRAAQLRNLAEQFPEVAGVAILRDAE